MSDADVEHYFAPTTDADFERASADQPEFDHFLDNGPDFPLNLPSLMMRHGSFLTRENGRYHIDVYTDRHQRHFAVYDVTVQTVSDWDLARDEVPF